MHSPDWYLSINDKSVKKENPFPYSENHVCLHLNIARSHDTITIYEAICVNKYLSRIIHYLPVLKQCPAPTPCCPTGRYYVIWAALYCCSPNSRKPLPLAFDSVELSDCHLVLVGESHLPALAPELPLIPLSLSPLSTPSLPRHSLLPLPTTWTWLSCGPWRSLISLPACTQPTPPAPQPPEASDPSTQTRLSITAP